MRGKMRYSIQDEDINIILNIESEVSDKIEQLCNDYVEKITKWGKEFNSELVFEICKKTIGIIDEDYKQSLKNFISSYDETGISFINISKRYRVGEEALTKVERFQNEVLEKALSHNIDKIEYICDGNARYSTEIINEYKNINETFLSSIEEAYDVHYAKVQNTRSNNVLADGIDIFVKYQYETLQKICLLYDRVFALFLEWYEKTLHENEALLKEINSQVVNASVEIGEEKIEELLSQIMDQEVFGSDSSQKGPEGTTERTNSDKENDSKEKRQEEIKKAAQKAVLSSVDSLLKELDSPEKIRDFKQYIGRCQSKFDEYKKEDKEGKKSKFKNFCDFIKSGAKKYGKSIMKALGIVVPLIAPEGHVATKIAKNLPAVMECFSGKENKEKDSDKIEFGLECMKSIGVDQLPESKEEIQKYMEQNGDTIAENILQKVFSSEKYRKVLDIDEEELTIPENQKLYKSITGKDVKRIPRKRNAYDCDFEQYNPRKFKDITPVESEEKVNKITQDVCSAISDSFHNRDLETVFSDMDQVKNQIESGKGYVEIADNNKTGKLIEELRQVVNGQTKNEVLENIDGRYNKDDIKMLCDEFQYEKDKVKDEQKTPDFNRACQNFIRRQMGYPAQYDKTVVKDVQELIPVINKRCDQFIIENNSLIKSINNAQNLANSKNSNIKRKSILSSLAVGTIGVGSYLGIGAMLAMGTLWPLGVAVALVPVSAAFIDVRADDYSFLVSNLGEERTEFLLKKYQNIDKNCFQLYNQ